MGPEIRIPKKIHRYSNTLYKPQTETKDRIFRTQETLEVSLQKNIRLLTDEVQPRTIIFLF